MSNPNLGVSVSEEFYIEQIEIARASLSKKVEFLTKLLQYQTKFKRGMA